MQQSEAPADSHGGWAPGDLREQRGPQETLSILPSTKWDHSLSSLWGRAGRRGRGVQECTLSPQYAAKAVGTTARFALSLGPSSPGCPHLFGFTEGTEGAGPQPWSLGTAPPGKPTAFPQPALRMASCSLPRIQQQKERPLPPSGNSHPQPNQAVCREEGGEEQGAAAGTGGSTREWTDGRGDRARVSICE